MTNPNEPTVEPVAVAGQQTHSGSVFPVVLKCRDAASLETTRVWVATHRESLLTAAEQCGAILFRGFPLATAEDFDAFVASFGLPNFPYYESLSNAVRVNRTPRVFTANEA